MIIDKTKSEFADVPETLNGEVLLERTVDSNGNPSGFLTAPVSVVVALRTKTDAELEATGWLKHKAIIQSVS